MSGLVIVGELTMPFGVLGWVKVRSFTDPPENILRYTPWMLESRGEQRLVDVVEGRPHAGTVVVRIEGFSNRDEALSLRGSTVMVPRDVFPRAPQGSFYWADLMGLRVETSEGIELGRVAGLMETGANDVLEVKGDRDRLIPFVMGHYVKDVRLDEGLLIVDWDPEF